MFNSPFSPSKAALLTLFAVQSTTLAQSVPVAIGEANGTPLGAGAFNATKDGLAAENGEFWGVSNSGSPRRDALFFLFGSRGIHLTGVHSGGHLCFRGAHRQWELFRFSRSQYACRWQHLARGGRGFFATFENGNTGNSGAAQTNAELTKNHMATEFNDLSGVTYSAPTEASPADLAFTTWTFTWEIAPDSPVIGTNPFFAVYVDTGGGGAAFWDDSTLTFTANDSPPPPAAPGSSISVNFHSNDSDALADHQLSSGEFAGLTPS